MQQPRSLSDLLMYLACSNPLLQSAWWSNSNPIKTLHQYQRTSPPIDAILNMLGCELTVMSAATNFLCSKCWKDNLSRNTAAHSSSSSSSMEIADVDKKPPLDAVLDKQQPVSDPQQSPPAPPPSTVPTPSQSTPSSTVPSPSSRMSATESSALFSAAAAAADAGAASAR
eukprot:17746-Heterococcus_DN1.PRE.1